MITLPSISTNLRRLAATMTVLTALLGLLASCSDELSGPDVPQDGAPGLSLRLNLPTASALGEAGNPDSPIFQATAEECRVNSLRFFAFPIDGNGDFVSETLDPSRDFTHERWQNYQIEITPGNYHVYVVANLDVSDVMNEAALKAKILRYRNGDEVVLPEAGSIPMIYEPQGDNAIVVIDKTQTELSASLQFTCVKVDLNLIFDIDNEDTKAQFGNHSLRLTAINGKKFSEATTLVWGGDYSARPAGKGKESFEVEKVSVGKYFTSWTRTDENAGVTDKTVINDLDGESSDNKSQLDKWLFRSTLYLPERYVATDGEQSELEVEGELLDEEGNPIDIRTKFMIPLGHGKTEEDVRVFPRSTYYEIIGDIVSLGEMDLNLFMAVREWSPEMLLAEFIHTTLVVSKTRASVSSKNTDHITYETNAFKVEFGCEATVDINGEDLPLIVAYKHDTDTRRIDFRVNPEIPLSAFLGGNYITVGGEKVKLDAEGEQKVYIKAGNIKKYLDVRYEVGPYFDVTPDEHIIQWSNSEQAGSDYFLRSFDFETNLGGVIVERFDSNAGRWIELNIESGIVDEIGNSKLKVDCEDQSVAIGKIEVRAQSNPVTTTVHTFRVRPRGFDNMTDAESKEYEKLAEILTVTVRPDNNNYRICFRAINDRQSGWWNVRDNGVYSMNLFPYFGRMKEGGMNNWNDGWYGDAKSQDGFVKVVCKRTSDWRDCSVKIEGQQSGTIYNDKYKYFKLPNDDHKYFYAYTRLQSNESAKVELSNKDVTDTETDVTGNIISIQNTESNIYPGDFGYETQKEIATAKDIMVPHGENHLIYIYTQLGETFGVEIDKSNVWRFTDWGKAGMNPDNTNTGWYYYDLAETAPATNDASNKVDPLKSVKPGETLMIFVHTSFAVTSHRCTHHMEPGISLFDYEDKEGWIVYDPSSPSKYMIYDDKPEIVDIDYIVYTKNQLAAWFVPFGISDVKATSGYSLTMWDIADCTKVEGEWWKTVIKLKAVKGETNKYLRLKPMPAGNEINLANETDCLILFNGNNYDSSNNIGYYDGSWHPGRPSGVNQ